MSRQNLPVNIQTMVIKQEGMEIYYPKVIGLENITVEKKVNQMIFHTVEKLVNEQFEEQDADSFAQMIGTYELKTNERNVLSLNLSNYAYAPYFAHGLTLMKSLTFDIETGKKYRLEELFKQGSNFQEVITEQVHKQIEERNIPLLEDLQKIRPNQGYYLADQTLVIYFQAYEITPGYIGLPLFPIPLYRLGDLIKKDGILDRLLGN